MPNNWPAKYLYKFNLLLLHVYDAKFIDVTLIRIFYYCTFNNNLWLFQCSIHFF